MRVRIAASSDTTVGRCGSIGPAADGCIVVVGKGPVSTAVGPNVIRSTKNTGGPAGVPLTFEVVCTVMPNAVAMVLAVVAFAAAVIVSVAAAETAGVVALWHGESSRLVRL